jgi:cytochrome c biogenesis protein
MWVNEPLVVDGMYFYQAFWGIGALTYSMEDGTLVKIPLTQTKVGGYLSKPVAIGNKEYVYFLRALEEPGMLIDTKTFKPEVQLVPGMAARVNGHVFKVETYHLFSGLETKRDPGIPVVYFGCGLLIMGLMMVPFSHREIWIRKVDGAWVMGGRTHKGRVMLRREMETIASHWGVDTTPVAVNEIGVQAS